MCGLMSKNFDMARGVDLAVLRDRKAHQHRWCIEVVHVVADSMMSTMAELARVVRPQATPVNIDLSLASVLRVDGPGCEKCKGHWTMVYGTLCPVSDGEYEQMLANTLAAEVAHGTVRLNPPPGSVGDPSHGGVEVGQNGEAEAWPPTAVPVRPDRYRPSDDPAVVLCNLCDEPVPNRLAEADEHARAHNEKGEWHAGWEPEDG